MKVEDNLGRVLRGTKGLWARGCGVECACLWEVERTSGWRAQPGARPVLRCGLEALCPHPHYRPREVAGHRLQC